MFDVALQRHLDNLTQVIKLIIDFLPYILPPIVYYLSLISICKQLMIGHLRCQLYRYFIRCAVIFSHSQMTP